LTAMSIATCLGTLMGVTALFTGTRLSILSLLLLFGGGLWLLSRVREPAAPAARAAGSA